MPRKNIAPILGRPALAYTLDHAGASRRVSRIVVSTEDDAIAQAARSEGAQVLLRPPELSLPDARLDHVLRHAVHSLESSDAWRAEVLVMLYGAVPVRPEGFIDRCIELLVSTGADSVRSVAPAHDRHPLWSVAVEPDHRIREYMGKLNIYRRQDLPPVYFYTGACVAVRASALLAAPADETNHFAYLGSDQRAAIHEPHECVEIHEPIDLEWAEFLLRRKARGKDG